MRINENKKKVKCDLDDLFFIFADSYTFDKKVKHN